MQTSAACLHQSLLHHTLCDILLITVVPAIATSPYAPVVLGFQRHLHVYGLLLLEEAVGTIQRTAQQQQQQIASCEFTGCMAPAPAPFYNSKKRRTNEAYVDYQGLQCAHNIHMQTACGNRLLSGLHY